MIKRILLIMFLSVVSFVSAAKENILIYAGPGVGPKSLANTISTIKNVVASKYVIKTIGPEDLIKTDWLQDTSLLIVPGGADLPYMAMLRGQANANIKNYVENGGKYLGICAGAYYAADRIEFAKGDPVLEVVGDRELKFFPGIIAGPTYSGFSYNVADISNMRVAEIVWQAGKPFIIGHEFFIFYYGGGHFVEPQAYPNVTVLANYGKLSSDSVHQPAAIVACKVGKGKAILSGVHFEWEPGIIEDSNLNMRNIKIQLLTTNADRLELVKHLLSILDIAV